MAKNRCLVNICFSLPHSQCSIARNLRTLRVCRVKSNAAAVGTSIAVPSRCLQRVSLTQAAFLLEVNVLFTVPSSLHLLLPSPMEKSIVDLISGSNPNATNCTTRQAYNDVIVLMVRRSFGRSSVGGGGGSDNEANSRTYMGIRRRYSNGSRSVVDSESDNDDDDSIADDNDMESYRRNSRVGLCDNSRGHASIPRHQRWSFGSGGKKDSGSGRPSSQCKGSLHSSESGGRKRQDRQGVFGQGYEDIESHNGSRSNAGYRYRWVRPAVRGTPPDTRLAHAATVVRITEGEVGCGAGVSKETFMLVFGGVGTGALYNDIHMLR